MVNRIFRISSGIALIILGIAGVFLPIVPGVLLIFLGFALMLDRNPKALFSEIVTRVKSELHKCAKK